MNAPTRSLEEIHGSVDTRHSHVFRRAFAFMGPAYLVSVGYMDPGNWATDIEGGARFGYSLVWVLLMSNLMAVLLQTLSARLGIVAGKDLAQACRAEYPRPVAFALWILCEIAIAACDLAEVLGTILGLNLLFGIPLLWGCLITAFDTFLLLAIQRLGIRKMEAFILSMVTLIGLSFLVQVVLSKPDVPSLAKGFVPSLAPGALFVAIGMLGATVMPHNLYLHSALVQSRRVARLADDKARACKYNLLDSALALNAAFFVNSAILIVSASVFHRHGVEVTEIQQAHQLLEPLLGGRLAPMLFGLALLAAGQSSTLTGTLAGQIVMEGFLRIRLRPWLRRLVTRGIALIPATLVIAAAGDHGTYQLLILSQVILSLQLPFAVIPLVHFTSERAKMGAFANRLGVKIAAGLAAAVIVALNARLVAETVYGWLAQGLHPGLAVLVVAAAVSVAGLLAYVTLLPLVRGPRGWEAVPAPDAAAVLERVRTRPRRHLAAALDRSPADAEVLSHAVELARAENARLTLVHVVDTPRAQVYDDESSGEHAETDEKYLDDLAMELRNSGLAVESELLYGAPASALLGFLASHQVDLLVMGSHGHRALADLIFGQTVSSVRHGTNVPVLVVRASPGT